MLTHLRSPDRPGNVHMIRERVIDSLDFGIRQQILIATIRFRNPESGSGSARLLLLARCKGNHLGPFGPLHRRNHLVPRNPGRTEDTPFHLWAHLVSLSRTTPDWYTLNQIWGLVNLSQKRPR